VGKNSTPELKVKITASIWLSQYIDREHFMECVGVAIEI
jgi:hypothetical protein